MTVDAETLQDAVDLSSLHSRAHLEDGDRFDVVRGDGLTLLWNLPDASVDAVVTDPPYCSGAVGEAQRTAAKGQGQQSQNLRRFGWFVGDNMGTAGLVFLLRALAWECLRVVKPSGSVVVFCDWRQVPNLAPAMESAGLRYQNLLVWNKRSAGLGVGFRAQHELALHFTVGAPQYHDKSVGNVLASSRVPRRERENPTEKPVDLLAPIVRVVAPPDGIVCDPFTGSGSTGHAALQEGRRFIGAERDLAQVITTRARLAEVARVRQGSMFPASDHAAPALELEEPV